MPLFYLALSHGAQDEIIFYLLSKPLFSMLLHIILF